MTDYHWTPANQRAFLEALAETGSVELACSDVSMSRRAAYNLRWKREGAAFRIGWDAAILVARAAVADMLMDRALLGQTVETVRDAENHSTTRVHYDRRLGYSLLARLDRMAERGGSDATEARLAHIVSQDFEAFLDLIEAGGQGAQAGLFVAARGSAEDRLFPGLDKVMADLQKQCELARELAADEEEEEPETPESVAADMSCWFDRDAGCWKTDFPPPDSYDGWSKGSISRRDYARDLDEDEAELVAAEVAHHNRSFQEAGEKARDQFFAALRQRYFGNDCCPLATDETQNDTAT